MNPIKYIKTNGIKHFFDVIYQYKINEVLFKIMKLFFKNAKVKKIIVIESHNDFDCNGGAFYDYLIKNNYNNTYKIVWLLKNKESFKKNLPYNVTAVPLLKPSIKKNYYLNVAKFLLADNTINRKAKKEQKSFYLTHGGGAGFKNVKGLISIPDTVDYILAQSDDYIPIHADQFCMKYPSDKFVVLGFPVHDYLNSDNHGEIKKITNNEYKKIVMWMPTFRKGIAFNRNDSNLELPLGIPLIKRMDEYEELNTLLNENDVLLIIKIHPMQDLENLKIKDMSNIVVLTGQDVKNSNIDNYKLLSCTDALMTDYSGVAYDYLQLNRPIAYVLDDMNEYKLGFVFEDIREFMSGKEVYNFNDLKNFIIDVVNEKDDYIERRKEMRKFLYKYNDTNNSERLAKFMQL